MKKINLKKTPLIVAVVGKGGVGKTVVTTLLTKVISEEYNVKMLLIDADPTHPHLSHMVKLIPKKSLEDIRLEAIEKTLKKEMTSKVLAENIDFEVYNAMAESKAFCLFSIGQPEGPGCFCPSNTILKKVLESITKDFDLILIDCEAGLEQINRMVIKSVDVVLIISDNSVRSIETANSIRESARKFTNYEKIGIIINKFKGNINNILKKIEEYKIPLLGKIPEDQNIMNFDLEGKAIIDLPLDSPSIIAIKEIVKQIQLFEM